MLLPRPFSLVAASRLLSSCAGLASRCGGCSCCSARSRVNGLQWLPLPGSRAQAQCVAHRFSCSVACGIPSSLWAGLIPSVGGLNRTNRLTLSQRRENSSCLPLNEDILFSRLHTWTETSTLPGCWDCLSSAWNFSHSISGPPACWLTPASLRNHRSQLIMMNFFLSLFLSVCVTHTLSLETFDEDTAVLCP